MKKIIRYGILILILVQLCHAQQNTTLTSTNQTVISSNPNQNITIVKETTTTQVKPKILNQQQTIVVQQTVEVDDNSTDNSTNNSTTAPKIQNITAPNITIEISINKIATPNIQNITLPNNNSSQNQTNQNVTIQTIKNDTQTIIPKILNTVITKRPIQRSIYYVQLDLPKAIEQSQTTQPAFRHIYKYDHQNHQSNHKYLRRRFFDGGNIKHHYHHHYYEDRPIKLIHRKRIYGPRKFIGKKNLYDYHSYFDWPQDDIQLNPLLRVLY